MEQKAKPKHLLRYTFPVDTSICHHQWLQQSSSLSLQRAHISAEVQRAPLITGDPHPGHILTAIWDFSKMIQLLTIGIFLPGSSTGPYIYLQKMQQQPISVCLWPALHLCHWSQGSGIFFLQFPKTHPSLDVSVVLAWLAFPSLNSIYCNTCQWWWLFLIAGTSAERLGKMQYLVSIPLCVTFARTGLFLGQIIR